MVKSYVRLFRLQLSRIARSSHSNYHDVTFRLLWLYQKKNNNYHSVVSSTVGLRLVKSIITKSVYRVGNKELTVLNHSGLTLQVYPSLLARASSKHVLPIIISTSYATHNSHTTTSTAKKREDLTAEMTRNDKGKKKALHHNTSHFRPTNETQE